MVLMGNPNPEKVMAGMIKKNAVTIACCCVEETVEISRPTPSMHTNKKHRAGQQDQNMAAKWNLKPERAHRRNQRNIEEANQKEGQRLAENEFGRTDGRDHDLLESADLALAHHGKSRQRNHQHQRQAADHSRHKEPATAQSGLYQGRGSNSTEGICSTNCGAMR